MDDLRFYGVMAFLWVIVIGMTMWANAREKQMWLMIAKERRMRGVCFEGFSVYGTLRHTVLEHDLHPAQARAYVEIDEYPLPVAIWIEYD
ncbi:MAG: hypothetical protein E6Q97_12470 [Desulfurellales bacterium]|nr:MAG: hypothetical protein E6Q97_12470 [Desulfurellales bacterium]